MKKTFINIGGAILLYSLIFFGVVLLNIRFSYINKETDLTSNYIAVQVDNNR